MPNAVATDNGQQALASVVRIASSSSPVGFLYFPQVGGEAAGHNSALEGRSTSTSDSCLSPATRCWGWKDCASWDWKDCVQATPQSWGTGGYASGPWGQAADNWADCLGGLLGQLELQQPVSLIVF